MHWKHTDSMLWCKKSRGMDLLCRALTSCRSVIYTMKIFSLSSWLMGLLFMWFYWWKLARKTKRGWKCHLQRVLQPWNLLPKNVHVRIHSHPSSYKNQRHCFRCHNSFGQLDLKRIMSRCVKICKYITFFLGWAVYSQHWLKAYFFHMTECEQFMHLAKSA